MPPRPHRLLAALLAAAAACAGAPRADALQILKSDQSSDVGFLIAPRVSVPLGVLAFRLEGAYSPGANALLGRPAGIDPGSANSSTLIGLNPALGLNLGLGEMSLGALGTMYPGFVPFVGYRWYWTFGQQTMAGRATEVQSNLSGLDYGLAFELASAESPLGFSVGGAFTSLATGGYRDNGANVEGRYTDFGGPLPRVFVRAYYTLQSTGVDRDTGEEFSEDLLTISAGYAFYRLPVGMRGLTPTEPAGPRATIHSFEVGIHVLFFSL